MRPLQHDGDGGKHSDQRANSEEEEVWDGHRLGCKVSRQSHRSLPQSSLRAMVPSPANATSSSASTALGLSSSVSLEIRLVPPDSTSDADVERRHQRMLKNRESASRSRARKQAYVNQLEQEIEQLLEENSRLKKEVKKLSTEMAAKQLYPLKNKLQRSATAPF